VEIQLYTFLTLAFDGREFSASCPSCFTPGERAPGTHWIEGWVCLTAVLDAVAKRKNPFPDCAGNQTSVIQPTAYSPL